jgi:hypothetical protein
MSKYAELRKLDVSKYVEQKNGLSYLSWSYAWDEFKKVYPDATYEIVKDVNGLPYFESHAGAMVYTKVTAEGLTYEMWLPVMDGANKAMKDAPYQYKTKYGTKEVEAFTMFDVNKTVMRCLVKNLAMFGLGLYIYSGSDLPESEPEPLDASKLIETIGKSTTMDELKTSFAQAYKVASKDKEALKLINDAKELKKKELA